MRSILTTRAAVLVAVIAPVLVTMAAATPVAAVELTQRCTNPEEGYTVNLPRGWYYNETVEADGTDDVAACRFFSPDDFEVRPGSGVTDVAIGIGREATAPRAEGEATTVGGKPAARPCPIMERSCPDSDTRASPLPTRSVRCPRDVPRS